MQLRGNVLPPLFAIVMVSHMGLHSTPQHWRLCHLVQDTSVSGPFCLAGLPVAV